VDLSDPPSDTLIASNVTTVLRILLTELEFDPWET